MNLKNINIVSFDIPYPPNYGGIIDVFYKIKALKNEGVNVHLHCFEYGKGEKWQLEKLCKSVNYYNRNTSFYKHLSCVPYIINSRKSNELVENLLKNDYTILMEGFHTCALLNDKRLDGRTRIYRESNIEHKYYFHLFKSEKKIFKKLFYLLESLKLKNYEKFLKKSDLFLLVSKEDEKYYKNKFQNKKVVYLPSFHENEEVESILGFGDYVLYHGNLSVSENILATEYLIDTFKNIPQKLVIAGLNPSDDLKSKISKYSNIKLVASPNQGEINNLIKNAQINLMVTFQATGLKLKLLNVLFKGRHCLVNSKMLKGTDLNDLCIVQNSKEDFRKSIEQLMNKEFSEKEIQKRKEILSINFSNSENVKKLINNI